MERLNQFTFTLLGEQHIAAQVDYRVCDQCGFRLMRVETTIINEQRITVTHCPICDQYLDEHLGQLGVVMTEKDRQQYFDSWLATHGLNQDVLDRHYCLRMDHFFDPVG